MLALALIYGAAGLAAEVCDGAWKAALRHDWSLEAHVRLWVGGVYAIGGLAVHGLALVLAGEPLALRVVAYTLAIYAIEGGAGAAVLRATGRRLWLYTDPWSIGGLVTLKYLPAWVALAFAVERFALWIGP